MNVEARHLRTAVILDFYAENGEGSGGRNTFGNIRQTATNDSINQTARAINSLQSKIARHIFKDVTEILTVA